MTKPSAHPKARSPRSSNPPKADRIEAIDLFCGAGGLSCGLKKVGVRVVAGIDVDAACQYPYEANHRGAKFLLQDVTTLTGADLEALWSPTSVRLLAGCAPCQPFSSYANTKASSENDKWGLLYQFGRLVTETKPDLVTMENVPGLAAQAPFKAFLHTLKTLGYSIEYAVLNAADYGAPQQRKRLVLLASLLGPVQMPAATHPGSANWVTVRKAVGALPAIGDGEASAHDPLHRAAALSALNQQRVRASRPGGTWRDWPPDLVAECHRKASGRHSAGVYGRMEWDKPAPTMTTLCIGYGNGRFGHPQQHRGISLREAAIFQSFPTSYKFVKPGMRVLAKPLARLIGNAVPPKLGEAVGRALQAAVRSRGGTTRV
ncbi:DNA cytosine methyltransferase [Polaromonas naphthalenivorans]|uniref:DNA (cytosine-5-)-methyltransferase n=1 Tax=Polaromonas naphthalenivorans (strain CJ2) TaxID=365044 RepID=A1VX43_POLNA|nr:DNA cytosine methyltransferase [Polaromonas naphthalenivorans]ABM40221.1 DNA-cytosine methyltransferase [Polaromonas naphthalenivorans CJ2]